MVVVVALVPVLVVVLMVLVSMVLVQSRVGANSGLQWTFLVGRARAGARNVGGDLNQPPPKILVQFAENSGAFANAPEFSAKVD